MNRCEGGCVPIKVLVGIERAKQIVDPSAPPLEVEAGLRLAFATIPGFAQARGECVEVDEIWWDLIEDFRGSAPRWHPIPLELASPIERG